MAEKNISKDISKDRNGLEYWEDTPKPDIPEDKQAKKRGEVVKNVYLLPKNIGQQGCPRWLDKFTFLKFLMIWWKKSILII